MEQRNLLKYLRVSVITECNRKCWYCFSEGIHEKKEVMLDVDSFSWIIGVLKEHFGTINVRFTGGEPLLNRNLVYLIEETKKVGISNIGITTNGAGLSKEFDALYEAGVKSFAIHITDINNEDWNIERFAKSILKRDGIRYNIVVTKSNYRHVVEFISFANEQKLDLLLLDLLENKHMTAKQHSLEYIDLELLSEELLASSYGKCMQNENCAIFYNENHNVKLVKRYTDLGGPRYCTQRLDMHPVLLTSDFNFRLCNHFGVKEIETRGLIEQRNEEKFIERINEVLYQLEQCKECPHKLVLN